MQKLTDEIAKLFDVENKPLLYELVGYLCSEYPQINDSTKLERIDTEYFKGVELELNQPILTPPQLEKKPGLINKLARITGELIPIKKLECAGYQPVITMLNYTETRLPLKDFYHQLMGNSISIRHLYYPEKDILFINGVWVRRLG